MEEIVVRGGLAGAEYAWGDELSPRGRQMANTWQGEFPYENTLDDGYEGTSPVGRFPPNGYGLFDMIGNVWEWTSSDSALYPGNTRMSLPRGKIIRGGAYLEKFGGRDAISATRRSVVQPTDKQPSIGFRLVRE